MEEELKMEEKIPSGGHEPESQKKSGMAIGWIIGAVIIILLAVILYARQGEQNVPEDNVVPDEQTYEAVDVPLTIILETPKSITAGTIFGVDWDIQADEQTVVTQTEVVWDFASHPGELGIDVGVDTAGYVSSTTAFNNGEYVVPAGFEDNVKISEENAGSVLYLRAHAVLLGKNYWSDEVAVPIKAFPTEGTETK